MKAAAEDIYVLFFPIQHQHDIFMVTIRMCLFNKNYNIQILDALDIP